MQKYVISGIILVILVVIFALQNAEPVLVKFYFWNFNIALALLIIGTSSIGFLMGMIFSRTWKKKHQITEEQEEQL